MQSHPPFPSSLCVAIVAENASYRFGGEASLPLHYFQHLNQRGIPTWLVAHGRTRPELEELFPEYRDRILTLPDRWVNKLLWQCMKRLPQRLASSTFGIVMGLYNQHLSRCIVADLIRTQGVTVVHQPSPVSPKAPSLLHGLGVPILIGPMNGGMEYPPAFRTEESLVTRLSVSLGRNSANLINTLFPGKKKASSCSSPTSAHAALFR